MINMWFKRKNDDVYTPQQEDKNAGRKKIAMIVGAVVVVSFIGWNIFSSDELPGGTPVVKVDQTGQTPGASMYTPKQERHILQQVVEKDGSVDHGSEQYGNILDKTMTEGINYLFANLGRKDNPMVDGVEERDVLARMKKESDQWSDTFYSEKTAFELMQLFNLTADEPLTKKERAEEAANGVAVANPGEAYGVIGDGITITDKTPKQSSYYVVNVVVNYKAEGSLPVIIEFMANVSNKGRIFDVTPIGIQSQQPGGN